MIKKITSALILSVQILHAQNPNPALVGYWQNWNDVNAPYLQLNSIDTRYNVVCLAFAIPHTGTDYQMEFIPDQVSQTTLISQIQILQSQGKKVLISVGGATAPVSLSSTAERDTFISTMSGIINTYGFDGMDIDLEGSSLTVSGGTISAPVDQPIIRMIYAIRQIMLNFQLQYGHKMFLTMAPETAFVQGGMSAYGGIWGAYLPVIHALRDSIEILQVQLYNSGSMYGIDGNIYSQGTADFIVAMTEAVIQGFNTAGGFFTGLPASKVAVGLPACPNAAGGGYVTPSVVQAAINYVRGIGPQPGSYVLANTGGHPTLRGMMTWSINWDAVSNCATIYEYAGSFQTIFGFPTGVESDGRRNNQLLIYPNPVSSELRIQNAEGRIEEVEIYNASGAEIIISKISHLTSIISIEVASLPSGKYFVKSGTQSAKFVKE
jgi:chitinase